MRTGRQRMRCASGMALVAALALGVSGCSAPTQDAAEIPALENPCVTGGLATSVLDAESGEDETRPAASATWTLDSSTGEELAHGLTDSDGRFTACAAASGAGASVGSTATTNGAGVTLTFSAERPSLWMVAHPDDADEVWSFTTAEVDLGTTPTDLGTVTVPASMGGAFEISAAASELYARRATDSPCWTAHERTEAECQRAVFTWADDVADDDGGFWDAADTGHIVLAAADASSRSVIVHELAHWWQNELYGGAFPVVTDCTPHYIDRPSSPSCAWTEGFADAVSGWVLDRRDFVTTDGDAIPFVPEGTAAFPGGGSTQGNVAAALLDLWALDAKDGDGTWAADVQLLNTHVDDDFTGWFTRSRADAGLPTSGDAAEIVRTHGIDIG